MKEFLIHFLEVIEQFNNVYHGDGDKFYKLQEFLYHKLADEVRKTPEK